MSKVNNLIDRIEKLEEDVVNIRKDMEGLDKSYENITTLVDEYQGRIQKSIVDLSSHFVESISPMIKKIVMTELEKLNGPKQ